MPSMARERWLVQTIISGLDEGIFDAGGRDACIRTRFWSAAKSQKVPS